MPLVTSKEMLLKAQQGGYAVGAFNAENMEMVKAIIQAAEELKAPVMISSHGRYNEIGRSCYYFADTKEGALTEVYKHCGSKKPSVQIPKLKKCKEARLIDLSQNVSKNNRFIDHLRFKVDNTPGKIVKEYLLPNFVAGCCKKVGIDGIKYQGDGYNCYVTWKDDYFSFEGNDIVEVEG